MRGFKHKRFIHAAMALSGILCFGTLGYWIIGGKQYTFLDALYMTVITISTIGYGEIIDMSDNVPGRIFTIILAFGGIGILFYIITNITAFIVEGDLRYSFWRKKMEKKATKLRDHYIVCGIGSVGTHVVNELILTKRPCVLIDLVLENLEQFTDRLEDQVFIEGDATDNDTLIKSGIQNAKGLFAATGDDNHNLVIALTAKQLNPALKIVAECNEIKNIQKMKKAGADAVVSTRLIGGLRMASEMIRPTVVSFLDVMLRDREKNLRIEEAVVPDAYAGLTLNDLNLKKFPNLLLLAVKTEEDLIYNPPDDYILSSKTTLIFMSTGDDRRQFEKALFKG